MGDDHFFLVRISVTPFYARYTAPVVLTLAAVPDWPAGAAARTGTEQLVRGKGTEKDRTSESESIFRREWKVIPASPAGSGDF